ncbi:phosphoribosyl transferase [Candidatus Adlerbacteria bacterium RIFCSPHIGHO2_01_FULL_54_23]|uniref:Phosphoribosyl transferase n=3 Tax=Candidatus Adleribacteriota TaxID=1752736 RepID=A0A1F4XZL0_9BACT|nr:MAG: hypothetical protein UY83_C0006G0024 [Candidatus Adlerbacteria bacterium GW2011_GWA1_54_10]KKW37688.1 MAG: hypothetical protein UY86_C0004G0017 [Candidatus Adlerbacteria bacterium GW2011_GWB1_54_7]OGC79512.1 MAG: phosphoribosyl transferase [Candidatus Adlerbacteria bacterium RIFCSPHIGHO2_01_FULL_54_23]OGC87160.1 MAG: phosphoribosyl transferase [Candidatus Adlerbacteria bacterium RIFCSPLOWO2_01_FULL_54_16]
MFKDREDAGKRLAERLLKYEGANATVLALPRGGVIVGAEVARALALPLDIVVPRKVGYPGNPEYAVCATDAEGTLVCNERETADIDKGWLKKEIEKEQEEARRRIRLYRVDKDPLDIRNKIAIIVDDGVATGLTMRLAVMAVKKQHPQKIIVAVPVAPFEAVRALREDAEVIVLEPPEDFLGAVGAHYGYFPQVEDAEVMALQQQKTAVQFKQ